MWILLGQFRQIQQKENVEGQVDCHISYLDGGIHHWSLIGSQFRKRNDYQSIQDQNPNGISDILYIDIGQSCQRIPENQGAKKEENGGPKNGNCGCRNHVLLVLFRIIEAEKCGFHSVRQNHVEEYHPGKYDGNFAIFGSWQYSCVQSHQQETQHSRQNRGESVNGGLFEKIFIQSQRFLFKFL